MVYSAEFPYWSKYHSADMALRLTRQYLADAYSVPSKTIIQCLVRAESKMMKFVGFDPVSKKLLFEIKPKAGKFKLHGWKLEQFMEDKCVGECKQVYRLWQQECREQKHDTIKPIKSTSPSFLVSFD